MKNRILPFSETFKGILNKSNFNKNLIGAIAWSCLSYCLTLSINVRQVDIIGLENFKSISEAAQKMLWINFIFGFYLFNFVPFYNLGAQNQWQNYLKTIPWIMLVMLLSFAFQYSLFPDLTTESIKAR